MDGDAASEEEETFFGDGEMDGDAASDEERAREEVDAAFGGKKTGGE